MSRLCGEEPGRGCSITSVFFKLIVTFMPVTFLSGTEEPVQLHRYCCMESLGRYCSFRIRQTSLDSLKICNCVPISTRTTHRVVVSVLPQRPQPSNSACMSTCVDRVYEWITLPKRNSCGVRHFGGKTACQTRHFASALTLCSRLDVCATLESISTATFPCRLTSRECQTAFLLSDSFEAFGLGGPSASLCCCHWLRH